MVVSINKLLETDSLFKMNKAEYIGKYAPDMNNKHKSISVHFLELESKHISGHIIDELMLSVLIIWYVVEKCYYKRIEIITEDNINSNISQFQANYKSDYDFETEKSKLSGFIEYEKSILEYGIFILKENYNSALEIPNILLTHYFSIIKCFEDKLEYTRKKI